MNATNNFYVITYDLKRPQKDYEALYEVLKTFQDWQHPLESMWVIYTSYTADEISARLRRDGNMDNDDLLFVCRLQIQDRQGWLDKKFWEWLKAHPVI